MRIKNYIFILFAAIALNVSAQEDKASFIITGDFLGVVPSIASQIENGTFIEGKDIHKEFNPKRRDANKAVPGKGLMPEGDPLRSIQKNAIKVPTKEPILVWDAATANSTPTDPTGAVGPNHYINAWNSSFRIWDKEGNALTSSASLAAIWPGQNSGDPIVMYDQFADRFFISQFYGNGFLVAVSQGPDPVNDDWFTYQFATTTFPDYPKFSIWSDGYYITANKNSATAGTSEVVYAIDRDKILAGDNSAQMIGFPLPGIVTSGFYSPLGFNVTGFEMPPAGNAPMIYMQDNAWGGVSTDHLKIWNINVNWDNPGSSTISLDQSINTAPFDGLFDGGSFSNIPQPAGGDIDCLQATIMYMTQYRRFPGHNSVVLNFAVDLDGSDDLAGIRWYELRQDNDGDDWEIYQEGTYEQPDGHSAFCGSMAMDANGNIGMGYTVCSSTQVPSIRYTGRFSSDPLGTMTVEEGVIGAGANSDPATRYGDDAQLTVDPTDDKTFWHIAEYFPTGSRRDVVGVFKLAPDLDSDVGVLSIDAPSNGTLSGAEQVTITVRNYGINTQSNFPVTYQVDAGGLVTETFPGPIASGENQQYTFTTTANLGTQGATYSITACTALATDENNANDCVSTDVSFLDANDLGVTAISSPTSSPDLTGAEQITVTIENFGGSAQSSFPVTYTINGTPVTETVPGPLAGAGTMTYTFTATGDFTALGDYDLCASTGLVGDTDASNDEVCTVVSKQMCQPGGDCASFGDGIASLEFGSINNPSGCDEGGYGDYSDLSTEVVPGTTYEMTINTGYGDTHVRVWIDFNDNFVFEPGEIVLSDYTIAAGQAAGDYTESMDVDIPADAAGGEHLMRVKTNWDAPNDVDPCAEVQYGETEDYTVSVAVGIDDNFLANSDLIVTETSTDQFLVSLNNTNSAETLIVTVHNIGGQLLIRNRVNAVNGNYQFDFDMSYAASGVYLVRLGNDQGGKVQKITVK